MVYEIHHHAASFGINQLTASSLQALHIAAHLDAIETVIIPALKNGRDIVLDRFWWSTWVYGVAGKVNPALLRLLIDAEKSAWGNFRPFAAFLITRDRPFTDDQVDTWPALNESYRELIRLEEQLYPIHVIEYQGTVEDGMRRILAVL